VPDAQIPLVDVKAQYERLIPQIQERIAAVLDSGVFILGPNVRAFELEVAEQLGVPRTVGVANGTDALVLALDAMEIGPGDEVICPSFTFYATAESIARRGATPVFADIDPVTLNLDPEDVAARVTGRTRALMPVHLFGRVMPLHGLAELGIPIVEDAAQAYGAQGVAQVGALSTFSFFPTKNLFALGDGGLVAATDEELADRITLLRFHGSRDKKDFEAVGYNSRLDELQAAVLRLFLGEIEGWNAARREAAARRKIHHNIRMPILDIHIEDIDDIGVRKHGHHLGLAQKALVRLRVGGDAVQHHFDRHRAIEQRVMRAVHRAHAALPKQRAEGVFAECLRQCALRSLTR